MNPSSALQVARAGEIRATPRPRKEGIEGDNEHFVNALEGEE